MAHSLSDYYQGMRGSAYGVQYDHLLAVLGAPGWRGERELVMTTSTLCEAEERRLREEDAVPGVEYAAPAIVVPANPCRVCGKEQYVGLLTVERHMECLKPAPEPLVQSIRATMAGGRYFEDAYRATYEHVGRDFIHPVREVATAMAKAACYPGRS